MPKSRYRFTDKTSPHFMTAMVNHWLPLFTRTQTVDIILDSWRFLQREEGFEIYGYVILENHLHLIAASKDISHDMQRFKSYSARRIIDFLEEKQVTRWSYWRCLSVSINPKAAIKSGKKAIIRNVSSPKP